MEAITELHLPTITLGVALPPVPPTSTSKSKKRHRPRAAKVEAQNVHYSIVLEAARAVTDILKAHNISCAVFGSLASKLYGSTRCPKDVDLLVSQDLDDSVGSDTSENAGRSRAMDAAELKDIILRVNPRNFYLKLPRDPAAEYRIMWYRQHYRGPECKVDVLVPGTMHLPHLSASRVVHLTDASNGPAIPVVPFSLLLAHKLQGWDDHCKAEEAYKKRKQHQDAADVRKLIALRHEAKQLAETPPWDDDELFSEEFKLLTRERVKAYCEAFPDRAEEWKAIGFETTS